MLDVSIGAQLIGSSVALETAKAAMQMQDLESIFIRVRPIVADRLTFGGWVPEVSRYHAAVMHSGGTIALCRSKPLPTKSFVGPCTKV